MGDSLQYEQPPISKIGLGKTILKNSVRLSHGTQKDTQEEPHTVQKISEVANQLKNKPELDRTEDPLYRYLTSHLVDTQNDRLATATKQWSCMVCQRKFTTAWTLREHFRTHTGRMSFIHKSALILY